MTRSIATSASPVVQRSRISLSREPALRSVQSSGSAASLGSRSRLQTTSSWPRKPSSIDHAGDCNRVLAGRQGSAQGSGPPSWGLGQPETGHFTRGKWSRHSDLNRGPAVYESRGRSSQAPNWGPLRGTSAYTRPSPVEIGARVSSPCRTTALSRSCGSLSQGSAQGSPGMAWP